MFDLETYADKCSDSACALMRRAYQELCARDHSKLGPDHVFLAITDVDRPLFNEVIESLNLDPQVVLQALETRLNEREHFGRGVKTMSESLRMLLSNAFGYAHQRGRNKIESADLFVVIFRDPNSFPVELLKRLGADPEIVMQKIQTSIQRREDL